ncbi:FG-GAP-like repeat-containing protein, partial [Hymenobacter sp. ASUV-10]
ALGDVDHDGDLDLVVGNQGANTASVRVNNGSAAFTVPVSTPEVALAGGPYDVALGDLDNDGDLDLLTANYGQATVSVRLNEIPTIVSLNPTQGPVGSTLSITGKYLQGTTVVAFTGTSGNTVTTGFTINAAGTQITGIVVPNGAQTGVITITTPYGQYSSTVTFTVCRPVAIAQNVTVTLDANGIATVLAADVNNGSTANCGFATTNALSVSPSSFTCANLGANTVTLTVTDASGTTSTATATVTVTVPAATTSTTWTGGVNNDWNNCANWSYGLVPSTLISATLPASLSRYPVLTTGTANVKDLTIATGASLTSNGTATLQVSGDFANNGTATFDGPVSFVGSAATQALGGSSSTAFTTVTVNKASGTKVELGRDLAIGTSLTLTSGTLLTTGSHKVVLANTATITESETSYVTGTVETTRTLSTAGTGSSFGGIGVTLTPAASSPALPGSTLVRRITGSPVTGVNSNQSIGRVFDIIPTVDANLNLTMVFNYFDHELNSISESRLKLFKSENGMTGPWARVDGATMDASANTVTRAGIAKLSVWTLGNADAPLPVELTDFTAKAQAAAVLLTWNTASEKNNDRFEVERSLDGRRFTKIDEVTGQGTKATPTAYTRLDEKLPGETKTLYYRLRQVDTDGTATYSPVRVVTLTPRAAAFTVFPTVLTDGIVHYTYTGPALTDATMDVYSMNGQLVQHRVGAVAGSGSLALPGLTTGWYVVRLRTATGTYTARVYQP